jgi:hypothetical protein
MSQNKTLKKISLLLVGFFVYSSFSAASAQNAQPVRACVDAKLLEAGIDPMMQNRWNQSTFVGKIHIKLVKLCLTELSAAKTEETVMPASCSDEGGCFVEENTSTEVAI